MDDACSDDLLFGIPALVMFTRMEDVSSDVLLTVVPLELTNIIFSFFEACPFCKKRGDLEPIHVSDIHCNYFNSCLPCVMFLRLYISHDVSAEQITSTLFSYPKSDLPLFHEKEERVHKSYFIRIHIQRGSISIRDATQAFDDNLVTEKPLFQCQEDGLFGIFDVPRSTRLLRPISAERKRTNAFIVMKNGRLRQALKRHFEMFVENAEYLKTVVPNASFVQSFCYTWLTRWSPESKVLQERNRLGNRKRKCSM